MDIEERWKKALEKTEIIRPRIQELLTFSATNLPYIFLSESSINIGDSVVRKGEVLVEKASLILPLGLPQFEGFKLDDLHIDGHELADFLVVRGVKFPSLKYSNKTYSLDIFEGRLKKAIWHYKDMLQREENITTGLIVGSEDCWQFSVVLYICTQVVKSADGDIKRLIEEFKKKGKGS